MRFIRVLEIWSLDYRNCIITPLLPSGRRRVRKFPLCEGVWKSMYERHEVYRGDMRKQQRMSMEQCIRSSREQEYTLGWSVQTKGLLPYYLLLAHLPYAQHCSLHCHLLLFTKEGKATTYFSSICKHSTTLWKVFPLKNVSDKTGVKVNSLILCQRIRVLPMLSTTHRCTNTLPPSIACKLSICTSRHMPQVSKFCTII